MNMFLKASSLRRIEAKFYDCWREQAISLEQSNWLLLEPLGLPFQNHFF